MITLELVKAERSYFGTINRKSIDVQRAINDNRILYFICL